MQFQIKRDTLLKSLSVAHNIIERKNTIPILANVLLEIKNNILNIVATDLDIVFHDQISDLKIDSEGSTTTSATVLYDLLRKLPTNLDVTFVLETKNKIKITAKNSKFNLLCLPIDDFPNFSNDFKNEPLNLDKTTTRPRNNSLSLDDSLGLSNIVSSGTKLLQVPNNTGLSEDFTFP